MFCSGPKMFVPTAPLNEILLPVIERPADPPLFDPAPPASPFLPPPPPWVPNPPVVLLSLIHI